MTASATPRVEELAISGRLCCRVRGRGMPRPRQTKIVGVWFPGQACLARSIGYRVGRIVWIARAVESLSSGRDVGVCESFVWIVVHAPRHLLSGLSRREIRGTRPLVVVPGFVTELEVRDVFLDEDFVQKGLARDCFRRQPVIGALFIQLRESSDLVTGAIGCLGPDQGVLVVADERLLEIGSQPLVAG